MGDVFQSGGNVLFHGLDRDAHDTGCFEMTTTLQFVKPECTLHLGWQAGDGLNQLSQALT
jgi:hypothetical protein